MLGERPCDACYRAKSDADARRRSASDAQRRQRDRAKAQAAAERRLVAMYPDLYRALYVEELQKLGYQARLAPIRRRMGRSRPPTDPGTS